MMIKKLPRPGTRLEQVMGVMQLVKETGTEQEAPDQGVNISPDVNKIKKTYFEGDKFYVRKNGDGVVMIGLWKS